MKIDLVGVFRSNQVRTSRLGRSKRAMDLLRSLGDGQVDLAIVHLDRTLHSLESGGLQAVEPQWLRLLFKKLNHSATIWVVAPNELAAEYKLALQSTFRCVCRSWVIWYHAQRSTIQGGFDDTHLHLLHFVRNAKEFVFNWKEPSIRVPSARQAVYADARASSTGRLPDDTWLISPGNLGHGQIGSQISPTQDVLDRLVRACSKPGGTILSLFAPDTSVLDIAKRARRRAFSDGPSSASVSVSNRYKVSAPRSDEESQSVVRAYESVCSGWSVDFLMANPELNAAFQAECDKLGVSGLPRDRNWELLRKRKQGGLSNGASRRYRRHRAVAEKCEFASEIALRDLMDAYGNDLTLDELLATPELASEFDSIASGYSPGFEPVDYRWSALGLRKRAHDFRKWANAIAPKLVKLEFNQRCDWANVDRLPQVAGLYLLEGSKRKALFIGATANLRNRLRLHADLANNDAWSKLGLARYSPLEVDNVQDAKALLLSKIETFRPTLNARIWCTSGNESAA